MEQNDLHTYELHVFIEVNAHFKNKSQIYFLVPQHQIKKKSNLAEGVKFKKVPFKFPFLKANSAKKVFFSTNRFLSWEVLLIKKLEINRKK